MFVRGGHCGGGGGRRWRIIRGRSPGVGRVLNEGGLGGYQRCTLWRGGGVTPSNPPFISVQASQPLEPSPCA